MAVDAVFSPSIRLFFYYVLVLGAICETATIEGECLAELEFDKPVYGVNQTLTVVCGLMSGLVNCDLSADQFSLSIPEDRIINKQIINGTARFMVSPLSLSDNGNVKCYGPDSKVLAQKTLVVGVPPEKPHSIFCIVTNLQAMNCSWKPEIQSTGELTTTQTLYYDNHSFKVVTEATKKCPITYGDHNSKCFWPKSSEGPENYMRNNIYGVEVVAQNELETVKSDLLNFQSSDIVKLDRVKELKGKKIGKTWIEMSWEEPIPAYWTQKVKYRLSYQSKWDDTPQIEVTEAIDREKITYNMTDLIPHTEYSVVVSCITNETFKSGHEGFWSDPETRQIKTSPDVPGEAPAVTSGGYFMTKEGQIEVFWQPISEISMNGDFEGTRVRYFLRPDVDSPVSCTVDGGDICSVTEDNPSVYSVTLDDLIPNATYDICVDVVNEVGYNSSLEIQPIRKTAKAKCRQLRFYVVRNDQDLSVHLLNQNTSLAYTVYWCTGYISQGKCERGSYYKWMPMSDNMISISDVNINNAVVGMSEECYDPDTGFLVSSGMIKATDIFDVRNSIRKPSNLRTREKSQQAGTLIVEWIKPKWSESSYIEGFTLVYCHLDMCEGINDTYVDIPLAGRLDGKPQTYSISDLTEGQTYVFKIKSVGDNETSDYTESYEATIPMSGLQTGAIVGIASAVIVATALVTAALYCIIKTCTKKIQNFRAPMNIAEVPDIAEEYYETNGNNVGVTDPYVEIDQGRGKATYWTAESVDQSADQGVGHPQTYRDQEAPNEQTANSLRHEQTPNSGGFEPTPNSGVFEPTRNSVGFESSPNSGDSGDELLDKTNSTDRNANCTGDSGACSGQPLLV